MCVYAIFPIAGKFTLRCDTIHLCDDDAAMRCALDSSDVKTLRCDTLRLSQQTLRYAAIDISKKEKTLRYATIYCWKQLLLRPNSWTQLGTRQSVAWNGQMTLLCDP